MLNPPLTITVLTGLLLGCTTGAAQTLLSIKDQTRNADFSQSIHTKPMKTGTALPAVCTVGEMYFKTDAPAGQNIFGCTGNSVWSLQAASGPELENQFAVTASGQQLTVAPDCSVTEPCRARFGNTVYTISNPGTARITGGTGSGEAKLYFDSTGLLKLSIPSDAGLTVTASGLTVESALNPEVPSTGIPLADIAISSGSWSAITDQQTLLSTVPLTPGSGINISKVTGSSKIDVDPSVVPLLAGVNNYTGQLLANGASKTAPFKIGPVDPATCDASIRESFFNTTQNLLKFCTTSGAQGAWTAVSTAWGSIGGALTDQTDLRTALASKAETTRTINGHALSADVIVTKSDVGLGNVDNTSDANKPISSATQTALNAKVDATRKVNGHALSTDVSVTKADVGLSNVDNTSDANKPISSATQTALDLKESTANKGQPNGYAPLDATGKVPSANLPTGTGGSASAPLTLTGTTDAVQLDVQGNTTQTAPIMRVRTSGGVTALQVNNDGSVQVGSGNGPMTIPNLIADPPSPGNGDVWYNTTTAKFRKKEADAISDWGSAGGGLDTSREVLTDNFLNQYNLSCAATNDRGCGQLKWTLLLTSGAAASARDAQDGRIGLNSLVTNTTDTATASLVLGGYGAHYPIPAMNGLHAYNSVFKFKADTDLANAFVRIGFGGATSFTSPNNTRIDLRYDAATDTGWTFVAQANDTTTSSSTVTRQSDNTAMVPAAGHYYKLTIVSGGTSATDITFQLWDQTCGPSSDATCLSNTWQATANIGIGTAFYPYFGVECVACAASRTILVDYFGLSYAVE